MTGILRDKILYRNRGILDFLVHTCTYDLFKHAIVQNAMYMCLYLLQMTAQCPVN